MDYTVNLNSLGIKLGEDLDVSKLGWHKKGDRNETND